MEKKVCLHSWGAQEEANFLYWRWSLCGIRSGGAGYEAKEEGVCGPEEGMVQKTGYCPLAEVVQQTPTDLGSPSSVLPRCTAGRVGHALGKMEEIRKSKKDTGKREKEKKKIEKTASRVKMIDRDKVLAK